MLEAKEGRGDLMSHEPEAKGRIGDLGLLQGGIRSELGVRKAEGM